MRESALLQAARALATAARALARLKAASSLEDAWEQFLNSLYKIYEKLNAGVTGTKNWAWYEKRVAERERDELLSYLHAARNCDTHRLENINALKRMRYLTAPGGVVTHNLRIVGGKLVSPPLYMAAVAGEKLEYVDRPTFVVAPVVNKNRRTKELKTYRIPRIHKGSVIDYNVQMYPSVLGEIALTYFRDMLEDASNLR